MIEWIEEQHSGMLGGYEPERIGQATTQPAPTNGRLTNIEMIALAGVVISGISLGLSLWSLATKGTLS